MRISPLLLTLAAALTPAIAQNPPAPPARAPAVKPAPRAKQPTPPAPADLWHPLPQPLMLDQWRHDLELPLMQLHEMELALPHEMVLPELQFELHTPHLALPPLQLEIPVEPLLPSMPAPLAWGNEIPGQGQLSRYRPEQGTPEDSLFRAAREALNRGEYARASTLFQSLEQRFPRSRVAPSALYWRAFSLYRAGSSEELRAALTALKAQQERYPEAAADPDAATLRTRLYAALAARGDAEAANQLRAANASGTSCDREDIEVRAEALNALAQLNPPEARPTLKRVLARRDECSVSLRRRAVYILGRNGTDEAAADLLEVVKSDPDPGVRSDAIMFIGRSPGNASVKTLETLFNESSDDRTRQAVLNALRAKGGPEAQRLLRAYIEKPDLTERTRIEAIQQLSGLWKSSETWTVGGQTVTRRETGGEEDAAFLRGYYAKTDSRAVKGAILSAVGRIGGTANEQWLLGIAKNREEDTGLRREALSRIRTSALSIEELGKLFDALTERDLRYAVVNQLASRDDSAAVDKLIEIAKSGTDPQVRRQAIAALARKNDPRTTKLLLELVEKP